MPIEVRPIDPRNRRRKKTPGRESPKPTRLGKLEERPTITRGMIERRKEMEKRNRREPVRGMLTGGQSKIAAKAPPTNKIDAKDFAVLRAEKAKGRGQGLQDEKMKPGKVTKAALGILAAGLGAKKAKDKKKMVPGAIGGIGLSMAKSEAIRKILGKDKGGMGDAKEYKKYLRGLERVTSKTRYEKAVAKRKAMEASKPSRFLQRRMTLAGKEALKAAKATRIGKIAAGVAGAALLGKAALEKMYEKRTGKKPFTKRPDKKMGGGMMMQRPMGYSKGSKGPIKPNVLDAIRAYEKKQKPPKGSKKPGKMGGGMMMRPNPVGMRSGKSVKVKCKLGRNKPTKMY